MPASYVRSTPLRLTLLLGTVFVAAIGLAGVVAWQLVDRELAGRLDQSIREEFAVISETYGSGDITDLHDSVESHVDASVGYNHVYLLHGSGNRVLAGNISEASVPLGWSLVDGSALGLPNDGRYRVFSSAVGGNPLLIGASLRETEAVGHIVVTSLSAAAGVLTIIVIGIGALLAIRGERRLAEVRDVMQRVGDGQLDARIPISPRADDIDAVAQQVNSALDRLSMLVESMRQVSVDIAHDLKTPLNRVSIAVMTAASSVEEGSEIERRLVEAEDEIEHMNATFEALLRIAQIEAGSRRSKFNAVEMGALLSHLADLYSDVAEDAGQTMCLEIAGDLPPVLGDRDLLMQMFANLIENAIRHCQAGATIRIEAVEDRVGPVVVVSDDGPGVPEAEREAVFRRLYRLERSRTSPGTGLGLSLVKAIADLHDATVSLGDNRPGLLVTLRFRRISWDH